MGRAHENWGSIPLLIGAQFRCLLGLNSAAYWGSIPLLIGAQFRCLFRFNTNKFQMKLQNPRYFTTKLSRYNVRNRRWERSGKTMCDPHFEGRHTRSHKQFYIFWIAWTHKCYNWYQHRVCIVPTHSYKRRMFDLESPNMLQGKCHKVAGYHPQ